MRKYIQYVTTVRNILRKPLSVGQTPIHIQLEPTTACNLRCKTCVRAKAIATPQHLSVDHFQRVLQQIRPDKITFSGLGEPFTNVNLLDMIGLAKQQGCSINTTTNATLLRQDTCDRIVKSGLDLIKISIDGASRETYRKVRGEDKFHQVLDGIRALTEAKKRHGSSTPFVRLNYVMFRDNYQDIAATVELAEKLGVNAIYFQPLDLVGIEERQELLVGDLSYKEFAREIEEAYSINRHMQVHTNLEVIRKKLPDYWEKYQMNTRQQDTRICMLPWFSTYIRVDGIVLPCCAFSEPHPSMGNLWEQDVDDIWNGSAYQQFRKAIRSGQRPTSFCANCVPPTLRDIVNLSTLLPGFLK